MENENKPEGGDKLNLESATTPVQSSESGQGENQPTLSFQQPNDPLAAPVATEPKAEKQPEVEERNKENIGQDEPKYQINRDKERSSVGSVVTAVVMIIIVVAGIWYLSKGDEKTKNNNQIEENVNISVNSNQESGEVKIISDGAVAEPEKGKITVFYNNTKKDPNLIDCNRVYPLEREIEKKYDAEEVDTVRGLLTPLSETEKAAGWVSAIPDGTFLSYIKINKGTAVANFTGSIGQAAGSCAVSAIRAQIEKTLLQFPHISQVVICVDSNCQSDEILQP